MSTVQLIQDRDAVPQGQGATGAYLQYTDVTVKNVGKRVTVPPNCFSMTNHMVRQVKGYLPPGVTVLQFTFFPNLQWMLFSVFLFSFIAMFHRVLSLIVLIVVLGSFSVTCQYIHVVRKSLPWLRLVPIMDNIRLLNAHIEVEVNHLEGVFLRAREAGLCQIAASNGKMKFLVMKTKMAEYIDRSRVFSIVLFVFGLASFTFVTFFLIANWYTYYNDSDCPAFILCPSSLF